MRISPSIAQAIVKEISDAVNKNVNLMDDTGRIIASTNPERVGTEHMGARKIVEEKLECLTVCTDQEYSGSLVGINLPLYFRGDIVGVIGITGEWDQIAQYVQLIKKASEALLKDAYIQETSNALRMRQRNYLHTLLFGTAAQLSEDFLSLGATLRLDIQLPYRCLCISFAAPEGRSAEIQTLLDRAEEYLERTYSGLMLYRESMQLSLFTTILDENHLRTLVSRLSGSLPLQPGFSLKAGVDMGPHHGLQLRTGRVQAEKSLHIAFMEQGEPLIFYGDMTSGIYLGEISAASKKEYLARIFKGMSLAEMQEWAQLLATFYACDGSLNKTADKLFIHKNTLQYQLRKLASLTGYDPRSITSAGLYQTAIQFLKAI